jgi:hypothetical protein
MAIELFYAIIILIIIIISYEFFHGYLRQRDRQNYFKSAEKRAKELKRPLLVYGDPYNGNGSKIYNTFMDTYGCGDETVDLTGAPKCKNGIKMDILSHLKTKKSDSAVIFISCVLEYVDEIDEIISEIKRVAGSLDNVFIVTVNRHTLSAYFYSDGSDTSKRIIYAPPEYDYLDYKDI